MGTFLLKPETCFPRSEIFNDEDMMKILGLENSRKLRVLFKKSDINKKYSLYNFDKKTLNESMADICFGAISKLLKKNNIAEEDIDCVIACYNSNDEQLPGLSSRLFERFSFKKGIHNYPLFGLGCGAFIGAINLSKHLLLDDSIKNVLVVCCEAQTQLYDKNIDPDNDSVLMGLTLFGDGASAAIITRDSYLGKNKHEIIDVKVATSYSNSMSMKNDIVYLDDMLLENISPHIYELVRNLLNENNTEISEIKHWIIHSGGKKILEGVKRLFNLTETQMLPSIQSYRDHGNVSCASVPIALNKLYALSEDGLYEKEQNDLGVILGFGSGFFLGATLVRYL